MASKLPKSPLRYPGGKIKGTQTDFAACSAGYIRIFGSLSWGAALSFLLSEASFKIASNPIGLMISTYDLYCFWKEVRDNAPDLVATLRETRATATDGRALFEELTEGKR